MEEMRDGVITFYAKDQAQWRQWLSDHHEKEKGVWLIIYKKESPTPSVYYPEAVDEALCFGWVDSKPNKRDGESYFQYFSKRNQKSNWSKVNKDKVERLIVAGKMAPSGTKMVALARKNGTWNALDEVEKLIVPDDMQAVFDQNPTALQHWENFPPSTKRGILEWILNAKKPETRAKRISETVTLATDNIRANQYLRKKA